MSDQSFSGLFAVGTKVIVYQLSAKHFQEQRKESKIIIADETLEKRLFEGIIVSVGNKANQLLQPGQYVIFEKNAIRRLESSKVPNNILVMEDEMIYAVLEGVKIPNEVTELLNLES